MSPLTRQFTTRCSRSDETHVRSMIELPCGRTHVGDRPLLAIRRSRSTAHLVSKRSLWSVTLAPQILALALKSPASIILSTREDKTQERSSNMALNSNRLILRGAYIEMTKYEPQFIATKREHRTDNEQLNLIVLASTKIAAPRSALANYP